MIIIVSPIGNVTVFRELGDAWIGRAVAHGSVVLRAETRLSAESVVVCELNEDAIATELEVR